MKRFTATEKGAVLLAYVCVIFGIYLVPHPAEMYVAHPDSGRYKTPLVQHPLGERVSREKARVYGIMSVVVGIGIGWLVFHRLEK